MKCCATYAVSVVAQLFLASWAVYDLGSDQTAGQVYQVPVCSLITDHDIVVYV